LRWRAFAFAETHHAHQHGYLSSKRLLCCRATVRLIAPVRRRKRDVFCMVAGFRVLKGMA